ncbi:MAG: PadR family transcriptional regulator [Bacillota bacterium]|nr:PadR family transcriptional regulator [Bacillota bacterium]
MLSKLSNLVLGLIWKRPLNPYEITKLLERPEVQDWFPMSSASIYTTIKNLSKNGYIIGETKQEGNLPPKTIYSLTDAGEKALMEFLVCGLESYNTEASNFGISLFHICSIEKELAVKVLNNRIKRLHEMKKEAKNKLDYSPVKTPINFKMMLKYNVYKIQTELKFTKELLQEIEKDNTWDSSFVRLLK